MSLSMNVFHHQTTRPKFLPLPSSFHGRRIPHKPPLLVSFPAKTGFNLKFLHSASKPLLVSSPATTEFNPKFLHCSRRTVLVSPATKKFRPVLYALPRDNEEFSSDNEEEEEPINQEHGGALILSDNGEYVVREAELEEEFRASAMLKAEGLYEYRSVSSDVKNDRADMEFDVIMKRYSMHYMEPFMCVIAVRKEGENLLQRVIGTLDLRVKYLLEGETYPEELVKLGNLYSKFKKRGSEKCGIITNVTAAESARQQGVGSSMLKFAIEAAKEKGAKHVFLQVVRDNEPALALYIKMGFQASALLKAEGLYEYRSQIRSDVGTISNERADGSEDDYTWERPDPGCIKMNTDASVKKREDETYYHTKGAVIFRDSDGNFVCGCYFVYEGLNLTTYDSDLVERLTVQRGLEKATEFGFKWIWAETDNNNVAKQINAGKDVAKPILDFIEKHSIKFKITSINKDGNGAAHCLVSLAFNSNFDFTDPSKISKTLVKKLKNDKAGVLRRRYIKRKQ